MILFNDDSYTRKFMALRQSCNHHHRNTKLVLSAKLVMGTIVSVCEDIPYVDFNERNTILSAVYIMPLYCRN